MSIEAMKQALDALEDTHYRIIRAGLFDQDLLNRNFTVATALRERLAQPEQEPVATLEDLEQEIYQNTRNFVSRDVMEWMLKRYYTHPPQRTEQKPVAWGWAIMHSDGTKASVRPRIVDFFGCIQEKEPFTSEDAKRADQEWAGLAPHTIVTLYTHPSQRKPLTDDQIYEMYNEPRSDAEMLAFARAIEAAHGIKENT